MKRVFANLFFFFCTIAAVLSQETAALPTEWTMSCDRDEVLDLKENPGFYSELTRVTIEGSGTKADWKRLLKQLALLPKLDEVYFVSNEFTELPKAIRRLWFVPCVHIKDHDGLDLYSLSKTLRKNSRLTELSFEVAEINELPSNIVELSQVVQLNLVNPELTNSDEQKTVAFQIPIRKDGKIIRYIESELITWQESPEERKQRLAGQNKISDPSRPIAITQDRFEKKWKSFEAPVEELDVPKSYYTINPTACDTIVYKRSGTKLVVPTEAFVDASGNPITGPVQIDYREFRDPVDFVFSGIPMSFQENDSTVSFFSSAGMFEVNASVSGEEVYLAEGKNIEVKFVSTDSTKVFNTYTYNDEVGVWEQTGVNTPASMSMPKITPAIQAYGRSYLLNAFERDTTLFDERFNSFKYSHTYLKNSANWFANSYAAKKKVRPIVKCVRGTNFRTSLTGDVLFKIETQSQYHPEMNALKEINWKLIGTNTSRDLRKMIGSRTRLNDIRINQKGSTYELIFKGDSSYISLDVEPVKAVVTDSKKVYQSTTIDYVKYQKKLEARKKSMDKKIKKDKVLYYKSQPNKISDCFRFAEPYMNAEERKMTPEQFRQYAIRTNQQVDSILDAEKFSTIGFTRSLSVSSLGLTNCDIEYRMASPVQVYASFEGETNKVIDPATTFVIIPTMNASIQYLNGYSPQQKILLDQQATCVLLVIDRNDNVSYTKLLNSELQSGRLKRTQTFIMNSAGDRSSSIAEIKSAIGI